MSNKTINQFPTIPALSAEDVVLGYDVSTSTTYKVTIAQITALVSGGGGGGAAWGGITGTLANQTDLQAALDGKLSITGEAATVSTINGKIAAGNNVTVSGVGTSVSPYVINAVQNVFIQSSAPTATGTYLWINTSGGNLEFIVENGL
jgi:hypothetical protein